MNDLSLLSGRKENFDGIASGDNFTDKRFFTDKPLFSCSIYRLLLTAAEPLIYRFFVNFDSNQLWP